MEVLPNIIYRFDSYVEPMHAVLFRTTGFDKIGLIRPLWEQLNEYHHAKASRFREHYEQMTFEDRRAHFCRLHEPGHFRLDLVQDKKTTRIIGYCVSSVSADKTGEIESLFVDQEFRSAGIGTDLVTRGLGWMDSLGAVRKRVSVGDGNESAWAFYRKFGFYPRMTVLEQKTERDKNT
jgi:ribosomal protein S18 acetylase RimI-like enzyme